MFFRLKKSGEHAYVQIVENKRVDGTVRQSVVATVGRADQLAASGGLASLLATGAKFCDQILLTTLRVLPLRGIEAGGAFRWHCGRVPGA